MRVVRLFTTQTLAPDVSLELEDVTRHHAMNVLRVNKHSKLKLFNGDGYDYACEILDISKTHLHVKIIDQTELNNEPNLDIQLYLGISKSSHMDYAIQKVVEAGVGSVHPILMERSVTKANSKSLSNRHKHWQRIIHSACEQSGRAKIPDLLEACELINLQDLQNKEYGLIFDAKADTSIHALSIQQPKTIKLLIGPEGGISEKEVKLASQRGFHAVRFGPRILRTETAALAAVLAVQLKWGDLAE